MKNLRITGLLVLIVAAVAVSCKDDEGTPSPPSPYVGVWRGVTTVGDSLRFTISNVAGEARLTAYSVNIRYNFGGSTLTTNQSGTNSEGYATIRDEKLNFRVEPVDVEATFRSATELEGTYSGELLGPGSANPERIEGTFTATKD
ncbi:hypothetical protein HNQ92_004376 [Rhabdobacter roseus]|uniref:Lipocalin-like domain-containing protein n=1 Tax=Rhabdobacter roseus TaxID=1655419 RepID=A0A840TPH5_9BACT|nr:hypothetical protein [Rhabdobacter roseus]MBB5286216.1 hypothetical protein [Rhabdobacter roseus]